MTTENLLFKESKTFVKPPTMIMVVKSDSKERINIEVTNFSKNKTYVEQLASKAIITFDVGDRVGVFIDSLEVDILIVQEKFYKSKKRILH